MRVAAIKTRLQAAISGADLLRVQIPLPKPEFALRLATGEDDIGKTFDLPPDGLVGGLPHPGRAVGSAARDGDEDILLCPTTVAEHLTHLPEIDLELVCSVGQGGAVVGDARVGLLSKTYQVGAGAVVAILLHGEMQPRQKALQFCDMAHVFRADEQMQIHEPALGGRYIQSQLYIWEY